MASPRWIALKSDDSLLLPQKLLVTSLSYGPNNVCKILYWVKRPDLNCRLSPTVQIRHGAKDMHLCQTCWGMPYFPFSNFSQIFALDFFTSLRTFSAWAWTWRLFSSTSWGSGLLVPHPKMDRKTHTVSHCKGWFICVASWSRVIQTFRWSDDLFFHPSHSQ